MEGNLRLDSRAAIERGGDRGAAALAGDPGASLLVWAIGYDDDTLRMPPDSRLTMAERQTLADWIAGGMAWPEADVQHAATVTVWSDESIQATRPSHWAFRPVRVPTVPAVQDASWPANDIDRFLLAAMERNGVQPVADADPATLIRRLTFDLIGLPPTPAEVQAFVADPTPAAYDAALTRLLGSPHHGEHMARKWLDVARYADSSGKDENHAHGNAFRYRDWVVRAFNADMPWDAFVVAQLAGDLLAATDESERHDHLVATGFLQMGQKALAEQDKEKMLIDIADEQLDTIGRGFLGLTLSCARCHDHKFDPVRAVDYFALAGILRSTRTMESTAFVSAWLERPLAPAGEVSRAAAHAALLAAARTALDDARAILRPRDAADENWRTAVDAENDRWLEFLETCVRPGTCSTGPDPDGDGVWGGEFGRTPTAQGRDGRDHNPYGYTMWLAGGAVRGGMAYGATDEYGYYAVENRMQVHDLHATLLHCLGLDHTRLTFRHAGRDFRLTDVHGRVAEAILA